MKKVSKIIRYYHQKIIRCQRLFNRFYIRQFKVFSQWYKRQQKKTIKQIQSQLVYYNFYWRKKIRKPKIFIASCYGRIYQAYYIGQKKMTVLGLAMLVAVFMLSQIGLTASFFSDEEISPDNYLRMATLEINALGNNFAPLVSYTQVATTSVDVVNDGNLKLKYTTTIQNVVGELCPVLIMNIYASSSQIFSNGLSNGVQLPDTVLSSSTVWQYNFETIMNTNDENFQNKNCSFDLVFNSWQEEITDFTSGGYTDETSIHLIVNSGEWQQPDESCTLSQGYWKTHSINGPAPYDDTWALLGEGTTFYLSGQTYFEVLWTPPAGGNAYYQLAHQYIAAVLNQLNGASAPVEVQTAITSATVLFEQYTPADIGAMAGNNPVKQQFNSLAELLDDYNNGLIGPGHCEE